MEFKEYLKVNVEYNKIERAIKQSAEISFNEVVILNAIVETKQKQLSLDFLKELIGVSYALIHKYIKHLESANLISKIKSNEDARKWMIEMDENQLIESQKILEKVENVVDRFK